MTALTRRPLPALDALRAAHADADAEYWKHLDECSACRRHPLCLEGERYLDDADAAGRRWEWAQTGKWGTW